MTTMGGDLVPFRPPPNAPSVAVEWISNMQRFGVLVAGDAIYVSQNSFHCDGLADFLRQNPALSQAIAQCLAAARKPPPGRV